MVTRKLRQQHQFINRFFLKVSDCRVLYCSLNSCISLQIYSYEYVYLPVEIIIVKSSCRPLVTYGDSYRYLSYFPIGLRLQISGCRDVELTTAEMKIIDCNVHRLRATAVVTEAGTDVEMQTSSRITITRTAVTFKTIYADKYVKPNLPFTLKVSYACENLRF